MKEAKRQGQKSAKKSNPDINRAFVGSIKVVPANRTGATGLPQSLWEVGQPHLVASSRLRILAARLRGAPLNRQAETTCRSPLGHSQSVPAICLRLQWTPWCFRVA